MRLKDGWRIWSAGDTPAPADRHAGDGDGPLFDEELLAKLRRIALLSRQSIAEGLAGEHRSKRRGQSPEFADFKMYSQGDDFRRIDWNLYARLDEVFVRLSEVTTELTVHVLLDASNSMDWRGDSTRPTKLRYALQLAGSLCYVSLWRFDRVVIAPFGATFAQPFGPAQGRAHVMPMLRYLSTVRPQGTTALTRSIDLYVRGRHRPGLLLILSDLLSGEPADLAEQLRTLRTRGWQTIVLHVVDETELEPAAITAGMDSRSGQPAELLEVESGERIRVTASTAVIERYQTAIGSWLAEIEAICTDNQADYLRLQTSWAIDAIVLRLLNERGIVA
jgi:uncharacterized protein (DUF58 family)